MGLRRHYLPGIAGASLLLLISITATRSGSGAQDKTAVKEEGGTVRKPAAKNTAGQTVSPRGPYNVKKAVLIWLKKDTPQGNARLLVEFHQSPASANVSLDNNGKKVTLKADGKGTYSAVVRIDPTEFAEDAESAKPAKAAKTLVFDGRHVVGERERARALRHKPGETIDLLGVPSCSASADPMRTLMVIHPKVVGDLTRTYDPLHDKGNGHGVWSFGHVATVLADEANTGIPPDAFIRRWLGRWEHDQVVNDFTAEKREKIRDLILAPWPLVPGTKRLDLAKAPFRLLAIVNRVDLRDNLLFDIPPAALVKAPMDVRFSPVVFRESSGGEARLIYGAVDLKSKKPLPFTVIFEFGVHKRGCREIKTWAKQWYDLQRHPLGSPRYNRALARITGQFVQPAPDPAKPPRPFGLNQVRTNEVALAAPWELREFRVPHEGSEKGHLRQGTVGQTPNNARPDSSPENLNEKPAIADYVNANVADLLVNTHIVPLQFPPGQAFLGARSLTVDPSFVWKATAIANNDARHHFSLNTCNGCHGGETRTPRFVMVSPTENNGPMEPEGAKLAPFLLGTGIFKDPVDNVTDRQFNDLARRRQDLETLVCFPCIFQLFHRPVRMTH